MIHLFIKIAQRYAKSTALAWMVVILLDLALAKTDQSQSRLLTSILGFFLISILSAGVLNATGWPVLLRRTSQSVRQFWFFVFSILLFNLAFNFLCFFLNKKIVWSEEVATDVFHSTPLDYFWVTLITFSFTLIALSDPKAMLANAALKTTKQVLVLFGFYAWMIALFPLFMYSRLLCYTFAESTIIMTFFLKTGFSLASIRRPLRMRALTLCLFGLGLVAFTSYAVEISKAPEPSAFLGQIGPKIKWSFSELETIDSPSRWVAWFSSGKNISADETIRALEKLESLCPPQPTDHPTVIHCVEKEPSEESLRLNARSDESDVMKRLNSQSVYVRLLGLLGARGLATFSPELKSKLEEMSRAPGRLNSVAENSLLSHGKGTPTTALIEIRREK